MRAGKGVSFGNLETGVSKVIGPWRYRSSAKRGNGDHTHERHSGKEWRIADPDCHWPPVYQPAGGSLATVPCTGCPGRLFLSIEIRSWAATLAGVLLVSRLFGGNPAASIHHWHFCNMQLTCRSPLLCFQLLRRAPDKPVLESRKDGIQIILKTIARAASAGIVGSSACHVPRAAGGGSACRSAGRGGRSADTRSAPSGRNRTLPRH